MFHGSCLNNKTNSNKNRSRWSIYSVDTFNLKDRSMFHSLSFFRWMGVFDNNSDMQDMHSFFDANDFFFDSDWSWMDYIWPNRSVMEVFIGTKVTFSESGKFWYSNGPFAPETSDNSNTQDQVHSVFIFWYKRLLMDCELKSIKAPKPSWSNSWEFGPNWLKAFLVNVPGNGYFITFY